MKSQIPMTYLPTKQGGGGEPTLSSEVLLITKLMHAAWNLLVHCEPPLISHHHCWVRISGLELTKFPSVTVADGARVAVLRVSI